MKKITVFIIIVFMSIFVYALASANTVYADYHSDRITLKQGMRNSEVYNLQNDLKALGYFQVNPTGYFGSITNKAVKNYQKDKNIAVDGIVGPVTSRNIKEDLILQKAKSYYGVP